MKRTHRPFLPPPLLHLRRIIYPGVTSKKGSLSNPSRIPYEALNTRKSQDANGFRVTVPKVRKLGTEIASWCNSCCRRSFRAKTQKSPHESQFFLRTHAGTEKQPSSLNCRRRRRRAGSNVASLSLNRRRRLPASFSVCRSTTSEKSFFSFPPPPPPLVA